MFLKYNKVSECWIPFFGDSKTDICGCSSFRDLKDGIKLAKEIGLSPIKVNSKVWELI